MQVRKNLDGPGWRVDFGERHIEIHESVVLRDVKWIHRHPPTAYAEGHLVKTIPTRPLWYRVHYRYDKFVCPQGEQVTASSGARFDSDGKAWYC